MASVHFIRHMGSIMKSPPMKLKFKAGIPAIIRQGIRFFEEAQGPQNREFRSCTCQQTLLVLHHVFDPENFGNDTEL